MKGVKRTSSRLLSLFVSFAMSASIFSGLIPGMSLTVYAAATEYTSLKQGDVLHVGDTINSTNDYELSTGSSLNPDLRPWTLVRGNIINGDITESETGAYYLLKNDSGTFNGAKRSGPFSYDGGYWPVSDTSDGIYVTSVNGFNVTFAVHEAPAHTHSFTYSASGATITATCRNTEGCPLSGSEYKATLTIAADGGTYDGTTAYSATVTNNIPAVTDDTVGDVAYYKVDTQGATTGGTVQTGAPTGAGYYYASVTLTSGNNTYTAVKAFTVAKIDPTAPTGLTATYGQKLSDVVLPTGWTWADSTQSVGSVGSNTFKANFAGNDNYNSKSNVDVTVTVGKGTNPATVTSTATVKKGSNTVDLAGNVTPNGAAGAISYEISGDAKGCSLSGSVLTSGNNTGSVTVNVTVAADENYNELAATPITVTISDKDTQTITASNVTVSYGDTGKKVTATTNGNGEISYAVKDGSADYIDVNTSTGELTIKKVGTATVIVTATETDTYAAATKEVTVTINKANAVAATVTANNRTYDGTAKPLVTVTGTPTGGTMQYALGKDASTAPTEGWSTSIPTATNAGTYYVWFMVDGEGNNLDTEAESVVVNIAKADIDADSIDVSIESWVAGEETNAPVITGLPASVSADNVIIMYAPEGSDQFTTEMPSTAGNYVVKVIVPESDNYKEATFTATLTVDPVVYSFVSGSGSIWVNGSNGNLSFTAKRNASDDKTFANFLGIRVDGKDVPANNYTAVKGSVVVTLSADYLNTLSVGEHTITFRFSDGADVTTSFTIKEAGKALPATGETISIWTLMGFACLAAAGAVISFKKWRKEEE